MKTSILTLESNSSTLDLCKNIALTMEEFKDKCFIYQVKKKSSILYCAVFTSERVSQEEAEVLFEALDLIRLYEREKEYLSEEVIDRIDVTYKEIKQLIERKVFYKLPKSTKLMEDLIYTYIK